MHSRVGQSVKPGRVTPSSSPLQAVSACTKITEIDALACLSLSSTMQGEEGRQTRVAAAPPTCPPCRLLQDEDGRVSNPATWMLKVSEETSQSSTLPPTLPTAGCPKMKPGVNPATWMLEVTGGAVSVSAKAVEVSGRGRLGGGPLMLRCCWRRE